MRVHDLLVPKVIQENKNKLPRELTLEEKLKKAMAEGKDNATK